MSNIKYIFIALALLSCTKKSNTFKTASTPTDQNISIPTCGTIIMTPSNSIYAYTNVAFEAILPSGDIQNLQWTFKKNELTVYSSQSNPVNHTFDSLTEGYGAYTAQFIFKNGDGNPCALKKSFQILQSDLCVKPSGISGPIIGYVGDEEEFNVNSEPCFQGSLRWDMNNDDIIDFTTAPTESVKYTFNQPGTYLIKTSVVDYNDDQATLLTHTIEIRNKLCVNPFTNTPVESGTSIQFAKKSSQCGQSCKSVDRVCNNGTFEGETSFTENPSTCQVSEPCPATYAWVASDFGKCTGACDASNGKRNITNYICKKTSSGVTTTASDTECITEVGTKPTGKTESCNVAPEDQTLNCLSCGSVPHNGTSTRWAQSPVCGTACTSETETCKNGVIPPFGASYAYTSQSTCPVTTCYTYSWKTTDYGACSAVQCGTQGVQTRNVTCVRNDGTTVSDSYCGETKPDATKACSARACYSCKLPWGGTVTHKESIAAYSSSSVNCGASCTAQTRTCNDGQLSGSFTNQSCSVNSCTTPMVKGSSCNAFMGSSIKWVDSATGKACGSTMFGSLITGDYTDVGGSEIDPGTQWMIPWDKAKYKGSAKVICIENAKGIPEFKVESGTCTGTEPNLITKPQVGVATSAECYASPVKQQSYGTGTCADYRQTAAIDVPIRAVFFNNSVRKFPQLGEYVDSFIYAKSATQGSIFNSAGVRITYKGETKDLNIACGDYMVSAKSNSTCEKSASVVVGGVTFNLGVGARNTIDPKSYVPAYISGFPNTTKTEVWSQKTCGVVTMSSSLGSLPPPCP